MMTSKFRWRATTWQSDDWFQMQGTVKRSHLMAMNLRKAREGLGIIRTVRGEGRQRTPANSLLPFCYLTPENWAGQDVTMRSFGTRTPPQQEGLLGTARYENGRPQANYKTAGQLPSKPGSKSKLSIPLLTRCNWAFCIHSELFAYEGGPPVRGQSAPEIWPPPTPARWPG
jgi:hypothetical protein